jgi:ABC-type lipoprotein export system ATPase subunit
VLFGVCDAVVKSDAHVYFVGSSGSGKSTLISRFLYPNKVRGPYTQS